MLCLCVLTHQPEGLESIGDVPSNLSASESEGLAKLIPDLAAQIKKGVDFASN